MVSMRDGIKLSTDIYFPEKAGDKLPVILMRTPYNKNAWREKFQGNDVYILAGQGYIVLVQDVRGKFESEGTFTVSASSTKDGYDAVTWAATQPWSNGNVGTYGCSYRGEDQIEQAKLRNPHLKAMIPQAAGGALGKGGNHYRYFGFITGGVFELSSALGWFWGSGSKVYYRPPPGISRSTYLEVEKFFDPAPRLPDIDFSKIWRTLPVVDMLKIAGAPPSDFEDFVTHEPDDPWWDDLGYIKDSDRFNVPALHISSWCDLCVAESLYLFNLFQRNAETQKAQENQFVIISPTIHCRSEWATEQTVVGERNLGDARLDYWEIYIRWFDYWLKGIVNGIPDMPEVQIYVMGRNVWRRENEWPLSKTKYVRYYLHSMGHANSRFGDGTLSKRKPGDELADHFVYDPKTPVPSLGGAVDLSMTAGDMPPGFFDQSEVEIRHDILVYTSAVLEEGIEVTGPVSAVLYVSSSARDTDFTVKLVDVFPDGTAYNVQDGILRARYREGFDRKLYMTPEEVYELKIDLHATSNYFKPGHRIRVEVSSSNFPRLERNLNTGGNNYDENKWIIAKNTVHHSGKYPSHILLPVIK